MKRFPTVILEHRTRGGRHFDWMMIPPRHAALPAGRPVWTARVRHPFRVWPSIGAWLVETIGAHRRAYLTYQGPIDGGRGSVRRVDRGTYLPRTWQRDHIVIELRSHSCVGRVTMRRLDRQLWRAAWSNL